MKGGLDVLAIFLFAIYIAILPERYSDVLGIMGAAFLAGFLVLYNKKMAEQDLRRTLKESVEAMELDDQIKRGVLQALEESQEYTSKSGVRVFVGIAKVKMDSTNGESLDDASS